MQQSVVKNIKFEFHSSFSLICFSYSIIFLSQFCWHRQSHVSETTIFKKKKKYNHFSLSKPDVGFLGDKIKVFTDNKSDHLPFEQSHKLCRPILESKKPFEQSLYFFVVDFQFPMYFKYFLLLFSWKQMMTLLFFKLLRAYRGNRVVLMLQGTIHKQW